MIEKTINLVTSFNKRLVWEWH